MLESLKLYTINFIFCLVCYFSIQDEDADFLAKLAKLMGAAGTQLLNSYNK